MEASEKSFYGFIGGSPAMRAAYHAIARMRRSKAPVLVCGETGTGKELAAEALHAGGPLVAINCAAIPHELLESEIFGHVKGAFTGAHADREGAARQADGGTLFLDEITEMPLGLQAKLLRFVQTGVFMAVGGTQSVKADIRFVSTTNRDPLQAVAEGKLRQDIYYRLSALCLHLPPLRARGVDVLLLAEHFLEKLCKEEARPLKRFSGEAMGLLAKHSWPGNVRELEGVIRTAVVMHEADVVEPPMLNIQAPRDVAPNAAIRPFADLERDAIERAVGLCGGNVTEAALKLGINPSTIHRKRKGWVGVA